MKYIPDDPIIACVEWTGYPPWMQEDEEEPFKPFAVYDPD